MKRFVWLAALLVGCQTPGADALREYFDNDPHARRVIARTFDESSYESGGAIVRAGSGFRVVVVPNQYCELKAILEEMRDGKYHRRDRFFDLLEDARPVHVVNNNRFVYEAIDRAMPFRSLEAIQEPMFPALSVLVDAMVLPLTYRGSFVPSDVVAWWHTHPNGGEPSRFDVNCSKSPFLVARRRENHLILDYHSDDEQQQFTYQLPVELVRANK